MSPWSILKKLAPAAFVSLAVLLVLSRTSEAAPTCQGAPPYENCCRATGASAPSPSFACAAPGDVSPAARRNILLLIADDLGYCHWGFMAGHCSVTTSQRCVSNMGCPATQVCISDGTCSNHNTVACGGDADCPTGDACNHGAQLALNELTCRNRQPRRRVKSPADADSECGGTGTAADTKLDKDNDERKRLPFNRSKVPCYGTQVAAAATTPPIQLQPALVTLEVDSLAGHSAVFPRAHGGGVSCKPARGVLHFGKQQRHLQWFYVDKEVRHECYDPATSPPDFLKPAWGCKKDPDCQAHLAGAKCGGGKPDVTGAGMARSIAYWLQDPGHDSTHNHDLWNGGYCYQARTTPCSCADGAACAVCTGSGDFCANPSYKTFLYGKGEVLTESEGGYQYGKNSGEPQFGKFLCTDDSTPPPEDCARRIDNTLSNGNRVPNVLSKPDYTRGIVDITQGIEFVVMTGSIAQQGAPFFLWYAPKIPHPSDTPEPHLKTALYGAVEDVTTGSAQDHFGRVSWFDRGVAALDEYLKKTCICGRDASNAPQRQSLFENTIVVMLADQGMFLPKAKFTSVENTHRTPIVISTPRHRSGALSTKIFDREFAHEVDVLPTVLAYAGKGKTCATDADCGVSDERCQCATTGDASTCTKFCVYAYGRNLRPIIEGQSGHLREAQYGEHGNNKIAEGSATPSDHPYIIPRPGVLGVCRNDKTSADSLGFQHLKPCLTKGMPGDCSDGDCQIPDVPGDKKGVCANRPDTLCDSDDDCADASLCDGVVCKYVPVKGSYGDFAIYAPPTTIPGTQPSPRTCATSAKQCLPQGVCRPLMLKVEGKTPDANGQPSVSKITSAWDLNYDPDQLYDLMQLSPTPAMPAVPTDANSVGGRLVQCLADFWHLDSTSKHWASQTSTCPWAASAP